MSGPSRSCRRLRGLLLLLLAVRLCPLHWSARLAAQEPPPEPSGQHGPRAASSCESVRPTRGPESACLCWHTTCLCAAQAAGRHFMGCIYGTNNELRGYTAGQYLDRYMVATQLEYRLVLPKRFGLVAFGGIGAVAPGGDQLFGTKDFLASAGGGLQFTLSKKSHVNLSADAAQGESGHTWSMGVGEAF